MKEKRNILFVCTYNKMRSRTGEEIYRYDDRFNVKSAGIDEDAPVQVDGKLLEWADLVVVMEDRHLDWIMCDFPEAAQITEIINLDIPDAYYFMEAELVLMIKDRFEEKLREFKK